MLPYKRYGNADPVTAFVGYQTGDIKLWPSATPPIGWLLCDGSEVSQSNYVTLYNVIGDNYNTPAASVGNFRLPDFRGRTSVGAGTGTYKEAGYAHNSGSNLIAKPLGEMKGATYSSQIPGNEEDPGTDSPADATFSGNDNDIIWNNDNAEIGTLTAGNAEGGNYPPYCVTNYVIKI